MRSLRVVHIQVKVGENINRGEKGVMHDAAAVVQISSKRTAPMYML